MSAEMSGEQMQAKIAAARRDAEGLKDRIKRKKDELADTSCKSSLSTGGVEWVPLRTRRATLFGSVKAGGRKS